MVASWSDSLSAVERFPSAALYAAWSVSFAAPPSRAARSMLMPTNPAVATRRTTSRMCSVCPRFSWMTTTPGTRPLAATGVATYAMSDAPSAARTSGRDTLMRGSVSFTVMPSVVGFAGGVAYGCATSPAEADGVYTVGEVAGAAVGMEHGERPAAVGRVVAGRRERHHDVWLAVEKARDLVHLHARAARAIDDEDAPLARIGELLEDV